MGNFTVSGDDGCPGPAFPFALKNYMATRLTPDQETLPLKDFDDLISR